MGCILTRYRTIVADPPWDHSDGTGRSYGLADHRCNSGQLPPATTRLPYQTMSVDQISALRIPAENDAHLFLWTTQRFLRDSWDVADTWGFRVVCSLVWCKRPMGFFGGTFYGNSTEFAQYCVRGRPETIGSVDRRWFQWPRSAPSERTGRKPEAFLDMVESVCPGPYLELFARRQRLGWDTWGNEALDHTNGALGGNAETRTAQAVPVAESPEDEAVVRGGGAA